MNKPSKPPVRSVHAQAAVTQPIEILDLVAHLVEIGEFSLARELIGSPETKNK